MKKTDGNKESESFHYLDGFNDQQFANECALQLFVATGTFAERQNGGRGGDDVNNPDERFLGNALVAAAGEGQDDSADKSKSEREGVTLPIVHVISKHQRNAGAEGGG